MDYKLEGITTLLEVARSVGEHGMHFEGLFRVSSRLMSVARVNLEDEWPDEPALIILIDIECLLALHYVV
jgi:hypothetical protein